MAGRWILGALAFGAMALGCGGDDPPASADAALTPDATASPDAAPRVDAMVNLLDHDSPYTCDLATSLLYHFDGANVLEEGCAIGVGRLEALNLPPEQVAESVSPAFGDALEFDGSGMYTSIDHGLVAFVDGFTVEAWLRSDEKVTASQAVVAANASDGISRLFSLSVTTTTTAGVNGVQLFTFASNCATGSGAGTFAPINVGEWTHVRATFDGNELQLFVNGVAQGAPALVAIDQLCRGGPTKLTIGGVNDNGFLSQEFVGAIDEVRVSTVAR